MERVVPFEPTWAIVVRETDVLVGVIGLVAQGESRSAELGYYVGRAHWGQGLATEAAEAVVRMGLESIGYAKLTSRYHADNPASGQVLAKLGFKLGHYLSPRGGASATGGRPTPVTDDPEIAARKRTHIA